MRETPLPLVPLPSRESQSPDSEYDRHVVPEERRLLVALIVSIAFLIEQLDSTIIISAIPQIATSFDVLPIRINLAITSYLLSLAIFMPISGWLADRYGARSIFCTAIAIFTVSSLLCGFSDDLWTLLIARVLQGIGGAMMTPVGRLILIRSYPRHQLIMAMTYMTIPGVIGPTLGPLIGGLITTYSSWQWIFFVNVPIGLLGLCLALRFIPDIRGEQVRVFDVRGFLLIAMGLALLQSGIELLSHSEISHWVTVSLLAAATFALGLYRRHARRVMTPALDISLVAIPTFRAGIIAGGISRIGINGVPFLLPLLFQLGFHMSPLLSGSLTSACCVGIVLARPASGYLLRTFGFGKVLAANGLLGAVCVSGFAWMQGDFPIVVIIGYVLIFSIIRGLQFTTINTLNYAEVPAERLSQATSLGGVAQQLAMGLGVSISASLLGLIAGPGEAVTVSDFRFVFLILGVITLCSLPGFLRLPASAGARVSGFRPLSDVAARTHIVP